MSIAIYYIGSDKQLEGPKGATVKMDGMNSLDVS